MIDDDSLAQRLERNAFPLSEKLAHVAQRQAAISSSSLFSLEKEAVWNRSALSTVRGLRAPDSKCRFEKSASFNPAAEQLARDYAVYKVAALHRIAGLDGDFPLTARLSVLQNHVA